MGRRKPQGRHAKALKIIQLVLDALEIAHAVTVAVGEGVNQQLISDIGKFVSGLDHGVGAGIVLASAFGHLDAGKSNQQCRQSIKELFHNNARFNWKTGVRSGAPVLNIGLLCRNSEVSTCGKDKGLGLVRVQIHIPCAFTHDFDILVAICSGKGDDLACSMRTGLCSAKLG